MGRDRWLWVGAVAALVFGFAACSSERRSSDDDDGNSSTSSAGGGGGGGGSSSVPGGPVVQSLFVTPGEIGENEVATFTATVTDPDGLDDLVGGTILGPDQAFLGAMNQVSGGTFELTVSYAEVSGLAAGCDGSVTFRAEFTDATGKVGWQETGLVVARECLTCYDAAFASDPSALCGWDACTETCEPGSECAIHEAYTTCLCSVCSVECELLCAGTMVEESCYGCMYEGPCSAQTQACTDGAP